MEFIWSDKSRWRLFEFFTSVKNISRRKSNTEPVKISGGKGGKLGSVRFLVRLVLSSCKASPVFGNLHRDKTAGKLYSLNHVALLRWALEDVIPEIHKKIIL